MKQEQLARKTEESLGYGDHTYFDDNQLLYSQQSILKKLDQPKFTGLT